MSDGQKASDAVGPLGGFLDERGKARFRVWAPEHQRVEVVLFNASGEEGRAVALERDPNGYFSAQLDDAGTGTLYKFRIDGEGPFPDSWSHAQPLGVHGPSQIVDHRFAWTDAAWQGPRPDALIIYELHVGTATPEGTFEALIPRLESIRRLGATAVELMPVASFPGERNWGYDGVSLNAPQASYGGPEGLKRLIDAAHRVGLAVIIDAVYNHFGPDGNYLRAYATHYFTARHPTPWGEAVNYDGEHSAPVRELVLRNAEMWIRDYHADGLRLDAVHAIIDESDVPLVQEIGQRARKAAGKRRIVVIAEDERNEPRLVRPVDKGGWGLDGVWADDFHHQMRSAFAGDNEGYYADYTGSPEDLATTLNQGWFYVGQTSKVHGKPRGSPPDGVEPWQLVHCIQNHDQIGNRAFGQRLHDDVSPQAFRAMSALLLLSPYTPLLFMGQEWNAPSPFLFFTDHNPELGKLVTEGRRREFEHFKSFTASEVPDPQAKDTFARSQIDWGLREEQMHSGVLALYAEALRLRAEHPVLRERRRDSFRAKAVGRSGVHLERTGPLGVVHVYTNIRDVLEVPSPPGADFLLWSDHPRFGGESDRPAQRGSAVVLEGPCTLALFERRQAARLPTGRR